jgi:ubiquinone/menaquinone biosynthesis C-methylase UbiE
MDLGQKSFWNNFYQVPREEWYFSMDLLSSSLEDLFGSLSGAIILHAGCGTAFLGGKSIRERCEVIEYDFSHLAFEAKFKKVGNFYNLLVADALSLPFRDSTIDVVVEKGLFDSLTSTIANANQNSFQMLVEYDRILRPAGFVVIYSIFGPDSEKKDTLGLLCHPSFTIECRSYHLSPAEIPSQDFCYIYIVRKN